MPHSRPLSPCAARGEALASPGSDERVRFENLRPGRNRTQRSAAGPADARPPRCGRTPRGLLRSSPRTIPSTARASPSERSRDGRGRSQSRRDVTPLEGDSSSAGAPPLSSSARVRRRGSRRVAPCGAAGRAVIREGSGPTSAAACREPQVLVAPGAPARSPRRISLPRTSSAGWPGALGRRREFRRQPSWAERLPVFR